MANLGRVVYYGRTAQQKLHQIDSWSDCMCSQEAEVRWMLVSGGFLLPEVSLLKVRQGPEPGRCTAHTYFLPSVRHLWKPPQRHTQRHGAPDDSSWPGKVDTRVEHSDITVEHVIPQRCTVTTEWSTVTPQWSTVTPQWRTVTPEWSKVPLLCSILTA